MKSKSQQDNIVAHGQELLVIFPHAIEQNPLTLCKKLRVLENKAHKLAIMNCNEGVDDEVYEAEEMKILGAVNKLLNNIEGVSLEYVPIFMNGDPRGYALKIQDDYVRSHNLNIHRDMGGYGIIAPEIGSGIR